MIARNIFKIKTLQKNLGGGPKLGWKLGQGFCHFLKVPSLVFPDIVQDYSLGQCLTASKVETSKKLFRAKWVQNNFYILILPSVHLNLFVSCEFCEIFQKTSKRLLLNQRSAHSSMKFSGFIVTFVNIFCDCHGGCKQLFLENLNFLQIVDVSHIPKNENI